MAIEGRDPGLFHFELDGSQSRLLDELGHSVNGGVGIEGGACDLDYGGR